MEIKLTSEQAAEFIEDKYIDIQLGGNHRIYLELDRDGAPFYFEVVESEKNKTVHGYAYNFDELKKLEAARPYDPSWHSNDPLCPNCQTYMIYKFEHCPKCGQKLDWSEK